MTNKAPAIPFETRYGPFVSATAPGIGRTESEDLSGIFEDHTAWVLDGADDPLADVAKCPHGATWYVRTLHSALAQSFSEDQPSLPVLLQRAIQSVRDQHVVICDNPLHRKPSAAVGIIRCGRDSFDYLVLGDVSLVLESAGTTVQVTDRRMHQVATELRHAILDRLRQGHRFDDPHRPALLRELVEQEQRARMTPTGYPIAAYEPEAALDSITESLTFGSESKIDRAALISDGAERAVSTFALCPDWQAFMRMVSTQGPATCIKRIREAELLDYSGKNHPRTKSSDDASITLWTRS